MTDFRCLQIKKLIEIGIKISNSPFAGKSQELLATNRSFRSPSTYPFIQKLLKSKKTLIKFSLKWLHIFVLIFFTHRFFYYREFGEDNFNLYDYKYFIHILNLLSLVFVSKIQLFVSMHKIKSNTKGAFVLR